MTDTVIVGILSLLGTLTGALGGVVAAGKLTAYRLQQLEDKVEKHNGLIERTYRLEGRMDAAEQELKDIKRRESL